MARRSPRSTRHGIDGTPAHTREFGRKPTWDVPDSIAAEARARGQKLPARVPPGPGNPLGRHWLGLSIGSVGIHGTNAPASIYSAVTHGCIRVHPEDVAILFDLVTVGTPGIIVYEPILLAEQDGDVYLEAHPDAYRRMTEPANQVARSIAAAMGISERIDWATADLVVRRREGIARPVTRRPAIHRTETQPRWHSACEDPRQLFLVSGAD
jgi:L,D-transpeptidase ErfK/SrfK